MYQMVIILLLYSGKGNYVQRQCYISLWGPMIHAILSIRSTVQSISQPTSLSAKNCSLMLDSSGIKIAMISSNVWSIYTLCSFLRSRDNSAIDHWAWDSVSGHDTATLSLLHQHLPQHLPGGGSTEWKIFHWSLHQSSPARLPMCGDWLLGWQYESSVD